MTDPITALFDGMARNDALYRRASAIWSEWGLRYDVLPPWATLNRAFELAEQELDAERKAL